MESSIGDGDHRELRIKECGSVHEQLVLPIGLDGKLLKLAHEVPLAGPLGVAKTKSRILQRYHRHWPGIFRHVAREVCQRSTCRKPRSVEMIPMPNQTIPKDRLGYCGANRFILTIVDYASCYPEAIALPSTEASRIAWDHELVSLRKF